MPRTQVDFFADRQGRAPALEWLRSQPRNVVPHLLARVERFEAHGYELGRPTVAPLRDGVHELRYTQQRVNYRLLYFYHGPGRAVLAHGCTKRQAVDPADIDRAIRRRDEFLADPDRHTYRRP